MIRIGILGGIGAGKSYVAKLFGNRTENGKMMFIYQAHQAFIIWHKLMPEINNEIVKLLD